MSATPFPDPTPKLLSTPLLRELVASGGVVAVTLRASAKGWAPEFHTANGSTVALAKQRGGLRLWNDPARALGFLRSLRVARVTVDMAQWETDEPALL